MKTYYISGKISGNEHQAKQMFEKAKTFLQILGYNAVNPFDNGLTSDDIWEKHLALDLVTLEDCDALVQLEGWEDSRGARLEREFALLKHIPIILIKNLGFYDNPYC